MTDFDTAVSLNDHWVLVTPEETTGTVVRLHVSVSVGDAETLTAADLEVTLVGAETTLTAIEAPGDGPLPVVESGGMTAFAQYTFDNPDQATPLTLTVGLGGETASFDLGDEPVA